MKQIIFLAGLVSALCLVGCTTKAANNDAAPQPEQVQPQTHQDLKGEVAK